MLFVRLQIAIISGRGPRGSLILSQLSTTQSGPARPITGERSDEAPPVTLSACLTAALCSPSGFGPYSSLTGSFSKDQLKQTTFKPIKLTL